MNELLDRLVANVGVDRAVAEKAVGIILAFLLSEGPADKVQALIDQMPGAEAMMKASGTGGFGSADRGGAMVRVSSANGSHLSISSSRAKSVCELIFLAAHRS